MTLKDLLGVLLNGQYIEIYCNDILQYQGLVSRFDMDILKTLKIDYINTLYGYTIYDEIDDILIINLTY